MKIKLFEIKDKLGIEGKYLLTRPIARRFVPEIHLLIKNRSVNEEVVEFSFEDIQSADTSFIDELIIVNVLRKMKSRALPHKALIFTNLSQSTLENARSVFLIQKIAITAMNEENKFILLGHLEQNLAHVLALLWEKKELRTTDLMKKLHITKSVASTKLAALFSKFLAIRKEEISSKGREYTYYSI